MAYSGGVETFLAVLDSVGTAAEASAPYVASAATATGAAAAGGAFSGAAGTTSTGATATGGVNTATSPTGPATSANPGGEAAPKTGGFFGNAVKTALVGSAVNSGAQLLAGGRRGVAVPPPPGAAIIDQQGAQAAAMLRARQAVAGGLGSTVTGAGQSQPAFSNATSGGKSLLGQ